MSKLTHLCMGASAALLVAVGLLWTPHTASAQGRGHGCSPVHQIAAGENLTVIAARYGVSVSDLVEENSISDANLIVEGQSLCIPAHAGHGKGGPNDGPNGVNGVSEWGSYGVPGQSYDPSLLKKDGGHDSSAEYKRSGPEVVPGKSYDPEAWGSLESYGSCCVPGKADVPTYDPPKYEPKEKPKKEKEHHGPIFPEYVPGTGTTGDYEPDPEPEPEEENGITPE